MSTDRDRVLDAAQIAIRNGNHSEAAALLRPLASQDDPEAQFLLADLYFESDVIGKGEAIALLECAGSQGHAEALHRLSALIEPNDASRARELLHRAGELGSAEAQAALGASYATGDWENPLIEQSLPGPKEERKALRWYRMAAEQGHCEAQYNLGFMLLLGEGAPADSRRALHWLESAAQSGSTDAMRLLADLYAGAAQWRGLVHVERDERRSQFWRRKLLAGREGAT